MDGAWLELGGAWLGHGHDRRGLAGGKDLGGARPGLGGSELVWEGQELEPSDALRTHLSYSSPSGMNMGLGPSPPTRDRGSRGQR